MSNMDWETALRDGAASLGLTVSDPEVALFGRYLELLLARNAQVNLTAITDPVEVARKHFVDSLTAELVWTPAAGERAVDIGTGAGFPGLPMAMRHPQVQVTLNDSVRKKVDFLRDTIAALGLENAEALWARAEELGRLPERRGTYDVAFARAVAHLGALAEYALPLLKVGGRLIAMKGPSGAAEIGDAAPALEAIGGVVVESRALTLPGVGERVLIVVRKGRGTPKEFPREPGMAKKRPLYRQRPA